MAKTRDSGIPPRDKRAQETLQVAYQSLEQRVEERTRELSTLLEVSHNIASTLEMEPLLGLILDQLKVVVDYAGATIFSLEDGILTILAYRGPIPQEEVVQLRFPLAVAGANREVVRRREPVIISDARSDTPLARAFRESAGERLETTFAYIRSWMGVPLMVKERVIGMLTLDHSQPNYYVPRQAELALAFANQVAVAIENARLYTETRRRADEIQTLFNVQQAIASPLEWDLVLQLIADEAHRLTSTRLSAVFLLEDNDLHLSMLSGEQNHGLFVGYRVPVDHSVAGLALQSGQPILVTDAQSDPRVHPEALQKMGAKSFLVAPLIKGSQPIGAILVADKSPGVLGPDDERVLTMLASGAVIQLENARLYEQAQQAATLEERQRLARELHDAVTQTLFSASLIAEVLPRLWDRNLDEGQRRLEELRQLTRGALAEMRTLLLELRPAALVEAELGGLLQQLAEAVTGRARVPVKVTIEGEACLPADVKVALYRIAQEALNNVAKHAGARQATVSLRCEPQGGVELRVSDDGRGFDPSYAPPDRLGLGIMRERAEAIGAMLTIESDPDHGTQVLVTWVDMPE